MNHPLFPRADVSSANAYFSVRTISLLKKISALKNRERNIKTENLKPY